MVVAAVVASGADSAGSATLADVAAVLAEVVCSDGAAVVLTAVEEDADEAAPASDEICSSAAQPVAASIADTINKESNLFFIIYLLSVNRQAVLYDYTL